MNIEYVRNLQFGYMRIAAERPLSKLEENMLSANRIEGMLPVQWFREDDNYLLCYEITGMQALDRLLENRPADEKLLKILLTGVTVTVMQLEKYLLFEEGVCLLPEMIFFDNKAETIHFCYYPQENKILQEQLIKLMEYLLAKTDHKNTNAVQLVYSVYEGVQNPSFCLSDLRRYVQNEINVYENEDILIEKCNDKAEEKEIFRKEKLCDGEQNRDWKENWQKRNLLEKIFCKLQIKPDLTNGIIQRFCCKKKEKEDVVLYEDEREEVEEYVTTILNQEQNEAMGVLKYEGFHSLEDIVIIKTPFVIGKDSGCDGIIKHPNISRYHAKITYQEGTYFIEDLNSTNGTMVNGGLLGYKTKVSLKKGQEVYLANEPYRFL